MIPICWKKETQPKMKVEEKNGVVFLTWPALKETGIVLHGFSTRLGGVSRDHLSSLNLSYTRGDDPENVNENYRRISEAIGFSVNSIVTSDQTHTTNIRCVTREDCGSGITRPRDFHDIDGLITDDSGVTLATFYADCVPLYFVDPIHHAIGLSHSGWRGTVSQMAAKTIEAMGKSYGTDPKDLITAIGPSICQDCYEVSEDVIEAFRDSYPPALWPKLYTAKSNRKYQLNLWAANQYQLQNAGVLPENIHLPNLCTCCNPELLYSHRASKGRRGNLAAFLCLK